MATTPLATRITELEDAIHELATNKVAEYRIDGKAYTYWDLDDLRALLGQYRREERRAATGGITYAKWVRQT
jgi:hypothetical protein